VSLFTIIQPDSFMLVIRPAERDLPRLEPGQAASVELDAVPGKVFKAQVRKISPTVDPDGSIKVTLDFEADAKPFLRNDAYARVLLVMDTHENALLVPKDALVNESGRQFLYIIDTAPPEDEAPAEDADPQYIAKRVEVVTGLDSDDKVEVASGIDDDDLIVTMGQHTETLKPGSRVRLTNLERELEARNGLNPKDALAAARAKRDIENQPAAASE
ncbi:MAG: HlyD family efflux transporter periplasmic adaptor subunit, partial [Candidatus Hydrogenedentes bacterium]|nr:HlyD family efflux transporter periplasmic adaptor subunit [Candidatus Hydrogenedentota bacterium]